jgi:TP53 regulating kinase-like protein
MRRKHTFSFNLFQVVIDFGLGFTEGSPEDKGVDLYVLERAFLSTHPNMEDEFAKVMEGYRAGLNKADRKTVVDKYEEIRMRGRKRTMVG